MTAADLTLRGPAYEWALWSTTARLAVDNPQHLPAARRLVDHELASVELAASRFRPDSELRRLAHRRGRPTRVSQVFAELLEAALAAARVTGGAVDPTLGDALAGLGYDRDYPEVAEAARRGDGIRVVGRPAPGWQRVEVDTGRRVVSVPADIRLDLGATAKAWAADRCAQVVAEQLGIGVLVSLGGDIATAGPAPRTGWRVLVRDQPGDPAALVTLPSGAALATSSTRSRQWRREGRELHHILDPATCLPVAPVWRSVTVAADSCVEANTWSTAAVVQGHGAAGLLAGRRLAARLLGEDGTLVHVGDWPAAAEVRGGVPALSREQEAAAPSRATA
jgi:FAD:protein FMN transferase